MRNFQRDPCYRVRTHVTMHLYSADLALFLKTYAFKTRREEKFLAELFGDDDRQERESRLLF